MADFSLTASDHELVIAAHQVLAQHYKLFWHTVAAAIRGRDGRVWTGLHLGTTVGRLAVCAEAVALGRAVLEGCDGIDTVVAVRHPKPDELDRELAVVPPCGGGRGGFLGPCPPALGSVGGPPGVRQNTLPPMLPPPPRRGRPPRGGRA